MPADAVIDELNTSYAKWYFNHHLGSDVPLNDKSLGYAVQIFGNLTLNDKPCYYFETLWWQSLDYHQKLRFAEVMLESFRIALDTTQKPLASPPRSKTNVLVFPTNGRAYTINFGRRPKLKQLQELVAGYIETIEIIKKDGNGDWRLYCNDDGFGRLPFNPFFPCAGTVVLAYLE